MLGLVPRTDLLFRRPLGGHPDRLEEWHNPGERETNHWRRCVVKEQFLYTKMTGLWASDQGGRLEVTTLWLPPSRNSVQHTRFAHDQRRGSNTWDKQLLPGLVGISFPAN